MNGLFFSLLFSFVSPYNARHPYLLYAQTTKIKLFSPILISTFLCIFAIIIAVIPFNFSIHSSMKRLLLLLLLSLLSQGPLQALSGREHIADMQRIMPFADNPRNKPLTDFYRLVNHYLDFPYAQLGQPPSHSAPKRPQFIVDHPRFCQIHWQGKHRIWFHWGFNTDPRHFPPLVNSLDQALGQGIVSQPDIDTFWLMLTREISSRNRFLMNQAAQLFGFDSLSALSAQQRRQINGWVTLLYSIHILGDHLTPDSSVVVPLDRLYADIYNALDNIAGRDSINQPPLKTIKSQLRPSQVSPSAFLDALERHFAPFVLSLQGPAYDYRTRFTTLGYLLR